MSIRRKVGAVATAIAISIAGLSTAPTASAGTCVDSMYRLNSSGGCVKAIQALTNYFYDPNLKVDGAFGPKTDAAIREIQSRFRIRVDGVVGPQTWLVLCAPQKGNGTWQVPPDFSIYWARYAGCPNANLMYY